LYLIQGVKQGLRQHPTLLPRNGPLRRPRQMRELGAFSYRTNSSQCVPPQVEQDTPPRSSRAVRAADAWKSTAPILRSATALQLMIRAQVASFKRFLSLRNRKTPRHITQEKLVQPKRYGGPLSGTGGGLELQEEIDRSGEQ